MLMPLPLPYPWLLSQVAELANEMVPSEADQEAVYRVLSRVRAAVLKAFGPGARAVLFGSRATGLSLNGGDVDIVILGRAASVPFDLPAWKLGALMLMVLISR